MHINLSVFQLPYKTCGMKNYDAVSTLQAPNGTLIGVMRSKHPSVYNWCIIKNFSCTFFKNYKEAREYCSKRNITEYKGGKIQ